MNSLEIHRWYHILRYCFLLFLVAPSLHSSLGVFHCLPFKNYKLTIKQLIIPPVTLYHLLLRNYTSTLFTTGIFRLPFTKYTFQFTPTPLAALTRSRIHTFLNLSFPKFTWNPFCPNCFFPFFLFNASFVGK